jgi:hypothetical protein
MINGRILGAWPNYLTVPVILAFWVIVGLLLAELLGAPPLTPESKNQ